jgi:glutamyl-Q tRNA(Asp) synthetase
LLPKTIALWWDIVTRMIVTRFAPSPTGYLHLGHAYAAITAHDTARAHNGLFLLRIEDIDASRCRLNFEFAIREDLAWLGLEWTEPALRQSERFEAYRSALSRLQDQGLLYPCFCTRAEIAYEIARAAEAPHGPEGPVYPGTCRNLNDGEGKRRIGAGAPFAMRLDVQRASATAGQLSFQELGGAPVGEVGHVAVHPLLFGDIVVARKETPASYHLSVVVDDAFQGVTRVTRGNDLFSATHVQRLLQAVLGLPEPEYAHHRLVLDSNGQKLSKRDRALTLRSLRESGVTPQEIRERILAPSRN